MPDYGFKYISSDFNKDVVDAVDKDLGFSSKGYTLKDTGAIGSVAEVTIPSNAFTNITVNFTHNLGYKPAFEVYFEDHDGRMISIPGVSDDNGTHPSCGYISAQTNSEISVRVGYYAGEIHGHAHVRKIYCLVFIEKELQ